MSRDARTRPIAHWTAIEAQIPTEVLRQDPSRSPVHHEGGAGKAALPIPRRAIDRSQDHGRQSPDCWSAATAVDSVPRCEADVLKSGRIYEYTPIDMAAPPLEGVSRTPADVLKEAI